DWSSDVCSSDLTCTPPVGKATSGLGITHGARDIDSTPPATATSVSPSAMERAAWVTASSPEAQSRFTVWPGTSWGRPASSRAIRATLRLSSPAWLAQPKTTSSTASRARPARSMAAAMTWAARSSGRIEESAPRSLPIGVRTAAQMKTSRMVARLYRNPPRVERRRSAMKADDAPDPPRAPPPLPGRGAPHAPGGGGPVAGGRATRRPRDPRGHREKAAEEPRRGPAPARHAHLRTPALGGGLRADRGGRRGRDEPPGGARLRGRGRPAPRRAPARRGRFQEAHPAGAGGAGADHPCRGDRILRGPGGGGGDRPPQHLPRRPA